MRIIVLGASGLMGHQLWRYLSEKSDSVYATLLRKKRAYPFTRLFECDRVIENVDACDFERLKRVLETISPDIVINCIGVTKRKEPVGNAIPSLTLNALLPHVLKDWSMQRNARVINFSTDCVFDGAVGNYSEDSPPTAIDLYGRTKSLGEIGTPCGLTLRSSFIGTELVDKTELLEWFLAQDKRVNGFTRAIYSGLTTLELCRVVAMLIDKYPQATGIYHVSSEPISKHELLSRIRAGLGLDVEIIPDDRFSCNRSLNSDRFRSEFKYQPPDWADMIDELCRFIKRRKNDL